MTYEIPSEELKTLDDVKSLSPSDCPMICLCSGFMSVFGFLVSLVTKDFWSHMQWLRLPSTFASQWWYFTTFPVDKYTNYSLKFWYNPLWTTDEKAILCKAIDDRLALPKWKTFYDIIGVVGEFFHFNWLNLHKFEFCSETIRLLGLVDPECKNWIENINTSPTPEEVNEWLKSSGLYKVWGRVQPG